MERIRGGEKSGEKCRSGGVDAMKRDNRGVDESRNFERKVV